MADWDRLIAEVESGKVSAEFYLHYERYCARLEADSRNLVIGIALSPLLRQTMEERLRRIGRAESIGALRLEIMLMTSEQRRSFAAAIRDGLR